MIEAPRLRNRRPLPQDIAGDVVFDRPTVDPDAVGKAGARGDVRTGELVAAGDAPRLANTDLRRDVDNVGLAETGDRAAQKFKEGQCLPPALDLAGAEFSGVGAVNRFAISGFDLRDVDAPLHRVLLRADDGTLAREALATDRKSTRLNSSHTVISYAVFCLKKK